LESGGLLATHYAHTNDALESYGLRALFADLVYEDAFKLVRARRASGAFAPSPSNAEVKRIIRADAETFHDAMVRAAPVPFFITCFARHDRTYHDENGLLTLWRCYGGAGEGLALGFNTRGVVAATEHLVGTYALASLYLDRVLYGADDEQLRSRLVESDGLRKSFLAYLDSVILRREPEVEDRRLEFLQFTVLAACAKHPDFTDERELRLVARPAMPGHENGRLSSLQEDGHRMLLPYLDALEQVIVGPGPQQEQQLRLAQATLADAGFAHVRVRKSQTPYRFL
jgi:hypothetical protein